MFTSLRKIIFIIILLSSYSITLSQDVYKTPSGAKYHLAACRMVENVSQKIRIEQAVKLGLEACKICKPQAVTANYIISGSKTANGQASTVQCKGQTQKGTRCRHMTRIANGYCFQHNPDKE